MPKKKTSTTQPRLAPLLVSPRVRQLFDSFQRNAHAASATDALVLLLLNSRKAGPDFGEKSMQEPRKWFAPDRCRIVGCAPLEQVCVSAETLIKESVKLTRHTSVDAFIAAAAIESAQKVFIERARTNAGYKNARGSAAANIANAIAFLQKTDQEITVWNIRRITRGNQKTIKAYLASLTDSDRIRLAL
jgi:hypothetical protein